MNRHKGLDWAKVQAKLEPAPKSGHSQLYFRLTPPDRTLPTEQIAVPCRKFNHWQPLMEKQKQ